MQQKKAIVLGGTVPHIELIKQLQERGYYVILVDYYENPVAKPYADEHVQESTLDQDLVYEIAKEHDVELVMASSVDQANITACYVMEKLGKTPPYSSEIALRITNKGDMKRMMWENNVPTSKYLYVTQMDELPQTMDLKYPVIVKPADSTSSKGVKTAQNFEELQEHAKAAFAISRNGHIVVEEFVVGKEASVYCYVDDEKANVLLISRRVSRADGQENAFKCYGTISGVETTPAIRERIEWSANAIAKAYQLKATPFFMQVFLMEDDISVIEFAPRTGGGMCFETVRNATGFNYIGSAIDSFLGVCVNCMPEKTGEIYAANVLYAKDGVFDRIEGAQALLEDGTIENIHQVKTKGMVFKSGSASAERVATLIIKGKSNQEISQKAEKAVSKLRVYDNKGIDVLRKDMYLRLEDIE